MTRQHFEMVANTIWTAIAQAKLNKSSTDHYVDHYIDGITDVAERLADKFIETNPRFDRARFMDAALNGGLLP